MFLARAGAAALLILVTASTGCGQTVSGWHATFQPGQTYVYNHASKVATLRGTGNTTSMTLTETVRSVALDGIATIDVNCRIDDTVVGTGSTAKHVAQRDLPNTQMTAAPDGGAVQPGNQGSFQLGIDPFLPGKIVKPGDSWQTKSGASSMGAIQCRLDSLTTDSQRRHVATIETQYQSIGRPAGQTSYVSEVIVFDVDHGRTVSRTSTMKIGNRVRAVFEDTTTLVRVTP